VAQIIICFNSELNYTVSAVFSKLLNGVSRLQKLTLGV